MSFLSLDLSKLQVGKPGAASIMQQIKDNEDALYSDIAAARGLQISNGSFEIDSDDDGVPDLWSVNYYPGGTGAFETTNPIHGAQSWKFVHPGGSGNGGGYIDSDYIECAELGGILNALSWAGYSSAAGMKNQVILRYFDKSKVYLSSATLFDTTSNPTSPLLYIRAIPNAPSTARYVKVRLVGGESTVDVAGTAYYDMIRLNPSLDSLILSSTITEKSRSSSNYADVGSVTIGNFKGLLNLSFNAQLKISNDFGTAYMRWRIGTTYSNERGTASESYVQFSFSLSGAPVDGDVTLYMQLKCTGATVYGKKDQSETDAQLWPQAA